MEKMRIYLVARIARKGYDMNVAHVVCAKGPTHARKMCADIAADEGRAVWISSEHSRCIEIKPDVERIVLTSFNAG